MHECARRTLSSWEGFASSRHAGRPFAGKQNHPRPLETGRDPRPAGLEATAGDHGHGGHPHSGRGGSVAKTKAQNHVMAVIRDVKPGGLIPYLPVTATQPPRSVKLAPMMRGKGFPYGADVTLSPQPAKVKRSIGATTMHVMPTAARDFAMRQVVSLDWSPQHTGDTGGRRHCCQHEGPGMPEGAKGH
jgi:hypothetical protein